MMTSAEIKRRIAHYYTSKLREHGPTHRGVDWNSQESQLLRFDQFKPLIPAGERLSILDYGCGYGALADHFEQAGLEFDYVGYDVSPEMLAAGAPNRRFISSRAQLTPVDISVASGIFNVRVDADDESWRRYTLETIADLASLSRYALGFNMLSRYSDLEQMTDRLFYADPCFYFDWCKRNLSRRVTLLHDYDLWEFTILIRLDA